MGQIILTFQLSKEKDSAVQDICRKLGIQKIDIAQKDYSQKLGYLANVKGFSRENKVYSGPVLPAEMLVFSAMNSEQVDAFLAAYKTTALAPIGLKAVVTEHNIFWTPVALFSEHMREHLFYSNPTSSGHLEK